MILETLCICLFSVYHGKNLRLLYKWSVVFLTHHLLKWLPDGDYFLEEVVVEEEEDKAANNPAMIQAYIKHDHDAIVHEDCLQLYQQGLQQHEPDGAWEQPPAILLLDLDGSSEASSSISQPSSQEQKRQPGIRRRVVAFQNVTIRHFARVAAEPPLATQPSKATARLLSMPYYNVIRESLEQYYLSLEEKQQKAPSLRAIKMRSTVTSATPTTTPTRDDWNVVVSETTVTVDEYEKSRRAHDSFFRSLSHTVSKNKKSTKQQQQQQQQKYKKKKEKTKKKPVAVQIMARCGARPFVLEGGRLTNASTISNRHRAEPRPTWSSTIMSNSGK